MQVVGFEDRRRQRECSRHLRRSTAPREPTARKRGDVARNARIGPECLHRPVHGRTRASDPDRPTAEHRVEARVYPSTARADRSRQLGVGEDLLEHAQSRLDVDVDIGALTRAEVSVSREHIRKGVQLAPLGEANGEVPVLKDDQRRVEAADLLQQLPLNEQRRHQCGHVSEAERVPKLVLRALAGLRPQEPKLVVDTGGTGLERSYPGVPAYLLELPRQLVWKPQVVGIQKCDIAPACFRDARVASRGVPCVRLGDDAEIRCAAR